MQNSLALVYFDAGLPPQEVLGSLPAPALSSAEQQANQVEGRLLMKPLLPLIKAAHQGELPSVMLCMGGQEYEVNDYVCRIASLFWYGYAGPGTPLRAHWLENLLRIRERWNSENSMS